jgi:predicted nucleic acid-binding protein
MPVVSNTSPILNLAIVDQLELLYQQFDGVLIPHAVLEELKVNEERPGSQAIREAISSEWIKVQKIKNQTLAQLLKQTLDRGESEAIALSIEIQADLTLLDEREARKIAKSLGLNVTGVLGILLRAKQSGQLASLESIINDLINKAGFRIAPELIDKILMQEKN